MLLQAGIVSIGSRKASILSAFEPVTSIVVGALALNESVDVREILGIMLIIASTGLLVAFVSKEEGPRA